ncbi:hypothetical protein SmJEL517_g02206 [Synchytrium microbalum]|uniref:cyclin-dependent kinase n=1 Tax=Synchytrium microbalum TaxID=1806994 RepID=A0A507C7Q6_9FUNG|nr:uncharacterized protein SmJEL517_g02206 [Synchytrium microbalum]TPX35358.1 hypothetical protein SmJEL517_g02206 [Synchytrium microbalum]
MDARPDTARSLFSDIGVDLSSSQLNLYQVNGTIGVVLSATHTITKQKVAIKKVPLKDDQTPETVSREVAALQACRSRHVVDLLSHFTIPYWSTMVFECCLGDLSDIITAHGPLPPDHVKSYTHMMLEGLDYIHSLGWMHRDIKPSNLLIAGDGSIRIGDFGLARQVHPVTKHPDDADEPRPYSNQVASRHEWYRAPELLYGARHYDFGVDMWAAGCIMAEMIRGTPLFPGRSDIEQLMLELATLPDHGKLEFTTVEEVKMETLVLQASHDAIELLEGFIKYSGQQRMSAKEGLESKYFANPLDMISGSMMHLPVKSTPNYEYDDEVEDDRTAPVNKSDSQELLNLMVIGVPIKLSRRN